MLEKECGAIPEGADYDYYSKRYAEYKDEKYFLGWEAALYLSEEVFVPDNYNE